MKAGLLTSSWLPPKLPCPVFFYFFDISQLTSTPLSQGNHSLQIRRDMYRRDVWLGQRSLKPHFWGQELRVVPNLVWGPVVFAGYSEIWSSNSSIHNIIHRLLSPKLQEWICWVWHQPGVEASSALAEVSQRRWSFFLSMQWFCTVVHTLIWDINSFFCKSN